MELMTPGRVDPSFFLQMDEFSVPHRSDRSQVDLEIHPRCNGAIDKGREVDILRGALRQDERKRGDPCGTHDLVMDGDGHLDLS